jgi:hypothetical protein
VFGKGVATPSGVPNAVEKRFTYKVREAICRRVQLRARKRPGRLPAAAAADAVLQRPGAAQAGQAIRLKSPTKRSSPWRRRRWQRADAVVNSVQFAAPLAEQTAFTLELPKDFKDASGRTLRNADSFPLKVARAACRRWPSLRRRRLAWWSALPKGRHAPRCCP